MIRLAPRREIIFYDAIRIWRGKWLMPVISKKITENLISQKSGRLLLFSDVNSATVLADNGSH